MQKVEVHHAGEWKCHLANTDVQELNMTRSDILKNIVLQDFLPYLAPVFLSSLVMWISLCFEFVSSPQSSLDFLKLAAPKQLLVHRNSHPFY